MKIQNKILLIAVLFSAQSLVCGAEGGAVKKITLEDMLKTEISKDAFNAMSNKDLLSLYDKSETQWSIEVEKKGPSNDCFLINAMRLFEVCTLKELVFFTK